MLQEITNSLLIITTEIIIINDASDDLKDDNINHISNLKIPVNLKYYFKKKDINTIIKYMKSDKKNSSSKINLILIKKIGKVIIESRFNDLKIKKFISKELIY